MTLHDTLEVHVELERETVLAGQAQFHRNRGALTSTTFQYDLSYLAHISAYPLDPALQLVSGTQETIGLPGAFSDSAPDRWGRNLIKRRERATASLESRGVRNFDDADFLAGVSDLTRQGALRYRAAAGGAFLDPAGAVPPLISLPELLRAADVAARDTSDTDGYEALKVLLDAGTDSLGGARPKASVLRSDGHQMIAKFPHHEDEWDVMAWEKTALDLADAVGISVPTRQLVRIDHLHVLLLTRFDRANDGSRAGYSSAMTMLQLRDGAHGDYVDLVEILAEISAQAGTDARQLFCRLTTVEARQELAHIAEAISRWREVATQNGVPEAQLTRFERSFEAGIATLRAA